MHARLRVAVQLFIRTSENGTYTIRRRKEEVAGQLAPDQPEPLVDKKVRDMAKAVHTLLMQVRKTHSPLDVHGP
jgi:hypothetical protein